MTKFLRLGKFNPVGRPTRTSGPAYQGAIVVFLAILGFFSSGGKKIPLLDFRHLKNFLCFEAWEVISCRCLNYSSNLFRFMTNLGTKVLSWLLWNYYFPLIAIIGLYNEIFRMIEKQLQKNTNKKF